jgi:hypothetical protein
MGGLPDTSVPSAIVVEGFTSVVQSQARPSRGLMQLFVIMEIQMHRDTVRNIVGRPSLQHRHHPAIGRRYDSGAMMMESRLWKARSAALDRSCCL